MKWEPRWLLSSGDFRGKYSAFGMMSLCSHSDHNRVNSGANGWHHKMQADELAPKTFQQSNQKYAYCLCKCFPFLFSFQLNQQVHQKKVPINQYTKLLLLIELKATISGIAASIFISIREFPAKIWNRRSKYYSNIPEMHLNSPHRQHHLLHRTPLSHSLNSIQIEFSANWKRSPEKRVGIDWSFSVPFPCPNYLKIARINSFKKVVGVPLGDSLADGAEMCRAVSQIANWMHCLPLCPRLRG